MWQKYVVCWFVSTDIKPLYGVPVWLWSSEWVDEDFNPEGIREGFYNDDENWTSCGWNACQDVYTTDETSVPERWAYRIGPKIDD